MNKYKCPEVGQAWHITVRVKCRGLDREVFIYSHIDCVAIEMGFYKSRVEKWGVEAGKSQYVTSHGRHLLVAMELMKRGQTEAMPPMLS